MKIGELARRTGLTAHTIRYYERIGLLSYARRDQGGQRDYDESILVWIDFIGRLKASGMPIRDMLRYAALRELGPDTAADRLALLEAHRAVVRAQVAELQACLLVLDNKIHGYADNLKRTKDHDTALPTRRRNPAGAGNPRPVGD